MERRVGLASSCNFLSGLKDRLRDISHGCCTNDTKRLKILSDLSLTGKIFFLARIATSSCLGQGGDSSKSALKMHTVYDLISKRFLVMDEHLGKTSDKVLCKKVLDFIKKRDLLIRDLGFFYTEQLKCIKEIGAFYLSRLPANVLIRLELNGKLISFGLLFKNKSLDGSTLDLDVFIGEERFPTRLVAYRVPDQVANQRRRDLNKDAKHRGR